MTDKKIVFEAMPEDIRDILRIRAEAFGYSEAIDLLGELTEDFKKENPDANRAEIVVNAVRGAYLAGFAHAFLMISEANEPEGEAISNQNTV